MQHAPSVSFPVGRSRFEIRLLLGLTAATLALLLLWWWLWSARMTWVLGAGAMCCALLGRGVWAWQSRRGSLLSWQAGVWILGGQTCCPSVTVDVGEVMLVRCRMGKAGAGQSVKWLWLEKNMAPVSWLDLRRALYSRAESLALEQSSI